MELNRFRLTLAALGLALAAPLAAQEAPAPAETPAAEAPADQAPAEQAPTDQAPADQTPATDGEGAPADNATGGGDAAAPQQPEVVEVVRDTFGDWQVRCAPDGNECFMYQLAHDSNNNPVAEVSILRLPESAEADAGVTVVTPLGTLLTNGVVLQVDTGEARQYPFAWCSQVGCFSRFGLAKTSIDAMKRGKEGKISLLSVAAPQTPVVLNLSLTGFTDAYNSLEVPPNPPGAADAPAPAAGQAAPAKRSAPLPDLLPRN